VDPQLQVPAIEYATALLMDICGGTPGPVLLTEDPRWLPSNPPVILRHDRLNRLVGIEFEREAVENILQGLGMTVTEAGENWSVIAPPARMDIAIEEDLIEEVARIHGYDQIPEQAPRGVLASDMVSRHDVPLEQLQQFLCATGFQEAINYSFVDLRQLEALHQAKQALPLANPLSADMDVMRTTLLPGLLQNLKHNVRRQQGRVRVFETGLAYIQNESLVEIPRIAAVAVGSAWPEQWSEKTRKVDFFDIKGEVERLVALRGGKSAVFEPCAHLWVHPGAAANVVLDGRSIGWCGVLHPAVLKELDMEGEVLAFELDLLPLQARDVPFANQISRFPSLRRDLAFWVPEAVSYAEIRTAVLDATGELLQNLVVFDVYHDQKLKKGYKSVAIGLILQHVSSTLTDESVEPVIQRAVAEMESSLGAYLRG